MAVVVVERKKLSVWERTYMPQVLGGMWITLKNFFKKKVTLEYPLQRPILTNRYRGEPTLIKDPDGREKCVACQLCEFVCPSKAILVIPSEIDENRPNSLIEKAPAKFEINMIRCIYCGYCQEVCPERAIVLQKRFSTTSYDRASMIRTKEDLYRNGGVRVDDAMKWKKVENTAKADKGWQ